MKKIVFLYLTLLLCSGLYSQNNPVQEKIALDFCISFLNHNFEECWKNFDIKKNPNIDSTMFYKSLSEMHNTLPTDSKDIAIHMSGVKMIQGEMAPFYSFKYSNDVAKPAGFLFDVLFSSSESKLVAGFQPKGRVSDTQSAASSKGKETVISTKEKIKIKNQTYSIRGVNIIHFKDEQGLVTIQIEKEVPTDKNQTELKDWAYNEGVKFAKWLYNSDNYKKSLESAKEQGIIILPEIGVSFVTPNTGYGYNVMIKEKDYK
jgi:hypothetical protein